MLERHAEGSERENAVSRMWTQHALRELGSEWRVVERGRGWRVLRDEAQREREPGNRNTIGNLSVCCCNKNIILCPPSPTHSRTHWWRQMCSKGQWGRKKKIYIYRGGVREKGGRGGATDGGMKVLIMAYGSDRVFVFSTRHSVFTQRKAIRGARGCICIPHKVSSNWEWEQH